MGRNLITPGGARVIEAKGKYVVPGKLSVSLVRLLREIDVKILPKGFKNVSEGVRPGTSTVANVFF